MSTINVLDATGATVAVNTPNADGQATMANSRSVVVASDQTVAVNQAGVTATANITALNASPTSGAGTAGSAASLSLAGATGFAVDVRGTFVATLTFQATINGTDWITLNVLPAGSAVNTALVSTATAPGGWVGNGNGFQQVRVTATAFTSGTATVVLRAIQAAGVALNLPTGQATQPITGTLTALTTLTGGSAAEDAATTANPHIVGGVVRTATSPTTLIAGDAARATMTSGAAIVNKPYSVPEVDWQNTQALTTTTAAAARTAGAAGIRNYVTGAQFSNSGASALDVIILDGATEIWRSTVAPNGYVDAVFQTPLRGTAATALNVNLSAAGTVRANTQGFQAA